MQHAWMWAVFGGIIVTMLALDLGVFHRSAHRVSPREAATWSAVWVSLALAFAGGLWFVEGRDTAMAFLAGYVVEEALSVDNLFVFLLLFTYFKVPEALQHRVLFWGIIGALVMRGIMTALGAILIDRFHWIIYVFGAFLVFTGIRMLLQQDAELEPERNPVLRLVRRIMPVSDTYSGDRFFVRAPWGPDGVIRRVATPLFVVLVLVETTDVVFAVDSIPAVFGITKDPFIVFTSNIFAILGLRSLYFLLAAVVHKFWALKPALSLVLMFVGAKMLASGVYHVPVTLSLGVIVAVLGGSGAISLLSPRDDESPAASATPLPAPSATASDTAHGAPASAGRTSSSAA